MKNNKMETKDIYIPRDVAYFEGFINKLAPNEIFVFGSNVDGIHGAGAAKTAVKKFGAEYGNGFGPQGQCYAIATKDLKKDGLRSVSLEDIKNQIEDFCSYAKELSDKVFLVTALGTELAGYSIEEISELFCQVNLDEPIPNNIRFDKRLWKQIFLMPFS